MVKNAYDDGPDLNNTSSCCFNCLLFAVRVVLNSSRDETRCSTSNRYVCSGRNTDAWYDERLSDNVCVHNVS